ncbi:Protein FAR1-RELATED SEQUENCE 12 [Bienertia sinuspersici]
MFTKKRWMHKSQDEICPRVRSKLEKNEEYARSCTVVAASDSKFQVFDMNDMLVENLGQSSCSCRWWDHYGIPCSHAVACCNWVRVPPENYVHKWMKKDSYLISYSEGIKLI